MELENSEFIINELGDGQVSGLASNENPIAYYNNLNFIMNN